MPRIQILPDRLISQIAAGEVVERPASVVKELVENSLDAGSGRLRIELESGGKRRIRIADDGIGMGRDDALLAFDRHATSKIASFEDLERVATLGFRGEALASIAAVSRLELLTAEEDGVGQRVRIEGGRILAAEPAARSRGSTVDVASLFFNVPARRKFLKSPRTELRRCLEVVQGYALANPEVRFEVAHEGRSLLQAPPAPSDREGARRRIAQIFGSELAGELVEIEEESGGRRIWGFVGTPATCRGRRIFLFVNRRLLRDRAVLAGFYRAVRDEWRSEDFPAIFLFLELPPQEVDVNVHPQKAEVRFRDPRLLDRISLAVRAGLRGALGGREAPLRAADGKPTAPLAWQPRAVGDYPLAGGFRQSDRIAEPALELPRLSRSPQAPRPVALSGREGAPGSLQLLGQYKGSLILLEGPDGLYLVDQHVAHERVLYERLKRTLEREEPASQRLLEPRILDLSPAEYLRLEELVPALEGCGFGLSPLSGSSLALTGVPAVLAADEAEKVLLQLADQEADEVPSAEMLRGRLLDALAASMACRAAVKMHDPLGAEEMRRLVEELFTAEQPHVCPHGRPVMLRMTDDDLEKKFQRS